MDETARNQLIDLYLRTHRETTEYFTKLKNAALYGTTQFREVHLLFQIEQLRPQVDILGTVVHAMLLVYLPAKVVEAVLKPLTFRLVYILGAFTNPKLASMPIEKVITMRNLETAISRRSGREFIEVAVTAAKVTENANLLGASAIKGLLERKLTQPQSLLSKPGAAKKGGAAKRGGAAPRPEDYVRPSVRLLETIVEDADQVIIASDFATRRLISLVESAPLFRGEGGGRVMKPLKESFRESDSGRADIDFFVVRNRLEAMLWAATYTFKAGKPPPRIRPYERWEANDLDASTSERLLDYLARALISDEKGRSFYAEAVADRMAMDKGKHARTKVAEYLTKLRKDIGEKMKSAEKVYREIRR